MVKRWLARLGLAAVLLLLATWGAGEVVYPGSNPPQRYDGEILSSASDPVLRRACFDCHSNETRHFWYRHLPTAALLMGIDIRRGRNELNFSRWAELDADARRRAILRSLRQIRRDKMPIWQYRLVHGDAHLTDAERKQLEQDGLQRYGISEADLTRPRRQN
jgi:Haem-binding domain